MNLQTENLNKLSTLRVLLLWKEYNWSMGYLIGRRNKGLIALRWSTSTLFNMDLHALQKSGI